MAKRPKNKPPRRPTETVSERTAREDEARLRRSVKRERRISLLTKQLSRAIAKRDRDLRMLMVELNDRFVPLLSELAVNKTVERT